MPKQPKETNFPLSEKQLIRVLWLLVIILFFTGGYFHARLKTQERYNQALKLRVARLQGELETATASAVLDQETLQ